MLNLIDAFLNQITMYRLVLYILIIWLTAAFGLGLVGIIGINPGWLAISTILLVVVACISNTTLAWFFRAPTNLESVYITALILALIITPATSLDGLVFQGWAAVWAVAAKYIFTYNKRHIFNPAAAGVWIAGIGLGQYATWWVGNAWMTPLVLIGGLLIARKIRRIEMTSLFLLLGFFGTLIPALLFGHSSPFGVMEQILTATPLFFLGYIMLTEPLTTPPARWAQYAYAGIVGILFTPQFHFGPLYSTPEAALLVGNVFSYLVSPKDRLVLLIKQRVKQAETIFDFVFPKPANFNYLPGQYLEWTLAHSGTDSRGSRRYFSLASSPTEPELRLGVKFYQHSSSYKEALFNMTQDQPIVATQLAGEFTLPTDTKRKLVFIAGGIGVTPFRSMIKYLIDQNERRDIIFFYAARDPAELVYRDLFDQADKTIGLKTIYVAESGPAAGVLSGRIDAELIKRYVPDYPERLFYISGPHAMITSFQDILSQIGVKRRQLKTDFFPGYV